MFKEKTIQNRIIDALIESKLVDKKKLENALGKEKETDLINRLVDNDIVSGQDLLMVLSRELDIPHVIPTKIDVH